MLRRLKTEFCSITFPSPKNAIMSGAFAFVISIIFSVIMFAEDMGITEILSIII